MKTISISIFLMLLVMSSFNTLAQNVIEDNGVGMSQEEVERVVARWSPQMQEAAATSSGDRLELLNKALISKKLEMEARNLTPEQDAELYWKVVFQTRGNLEKLMVDHFAEQLVIPDMTELAKERFMVDMNRYSRVPEKRISSHILVICSKGSCDTEVKKNLAESIHAKLVGGADFAELAAEYSDDTASKDKGGRFERWLVEKEPGVAKPYVETVFELKQAGDYSAVVSSSFGFHIIRLDEIKAEYYLDYEQVEPKIVKELEEEFALQSTRSYVRSFNIGDNATIDGAALEEIFSKYKVTESQ
jgi:peptidyl-prolyl cis-trans isomerase C